MKNVVHPYGTTISTSKDDRLVLHFGEGSVDKEQSLKYSIQRPDQEYLKQSFNYNSLVASVSDKINLDYEMSKFKKPISLNGTLSFDENKGSDFVECDVKVIGFQDKRPVILNTIAERVTDGRYAGKMEGYNGAALVAIKRGMEENEHFTETLKNELDLFYGNRMLCKLLLFHQKKNNNTLVFKAECCLLRNAGVIIANHKDRPLIFESGDILLPPHQRIRIRPSGCIRLKPGIQFHPFLFFMHVPIENNTVFSVELERRMGRSTNGIIEFSADNQRRGQITKAEFSLDFLSSENQRETLIRTKTTLSDNFRSDSTCSCGTNNTV